jgi:hypothetical protein
MGDPTTDPRAADLLRSVPDEVAALADMFRRVASQAECSASALRGSDGILIWHGGSAQAFLEIVGKLPGDLDNVQKSYGGVADALYRYEGHLSPLRQEFQSLANQIQSAQGSLSTAQGSLSSANTDLSTAQSKPHAHANSPAVVDAHNAVSDASATVNRLSDELSGLESHGYQLLDEFDQARGEARAYVWMASTVAPTQSWLSSCLSSIGNFLEGVGKSVIHSIADLPAAAWDFASHPSWSSFARFGKDLAVTASVVAMVAAPFAAPELAAGDLAADAGADALADAAGDAAGDALGDAAGDALGDGSADAAGDDGLTNTADGAGKSSGGFRTTMRGTTKWAGRTSTAATGANAVTDFEQGHYKAGLIDSAFVIAPNLGHIPTSLDSVNSPGDLVSNALHIGDGSVEAAAKNVEQLSDYKLLRGDGLSDVAARSLAFEHAPDLQTLQTLSNTKSLDDAIAQAKTAELNASSRAMHFGRPAANLFDNLVTEPSKDAIKHRLHAVPACE